MRSDGKFDLDQLIYANTSVGDILRMRREYFSLSVSDVENILNIRSSVIESIEKNDFSTIPGKAYVIGFIRSYAAYLELNAAKIVNLYKSGIADEKISNFVEESPAATDNNTPKLYMTILSFLLFVISVIFLAPSQESLDVKTLEHTKKNGQIEKNNLNQNTQ